MIFDNWKPRDKDAGISPSLLWEYDLSDFDWYNMRVLVMQRIIERGWPEDFYAAIKLYGGVSNVRNIIKEIPCLSPKDMNFVSSIFNLKKEELKCYKRKQLREQHLSF